jgi:ATP-dependent helicase/nuclease subunit A
VLRAVDAVFAADDVARGVALDGAEIAHQASRSGDGGLVELWPPVEPRASDALPAWKPPVEQASGDSPQTRLAELIAKRIARMIETREVLESKGRPIEAGDIMVLVRRRTAFVEDLIRQLKTLGIGVAGIDRMILTEQLAVMDLIALGQFLILPEDDLTLATVLKGPIVGLTEEQLFDVAFARTATLWAALRAKAGDDPAYAAAVETLSDLLARADYVPPFELFSEILAKRRGRERLTARLGPDAEDPIAEFLALAQAFERTHVPSLQGFLYWVAAGAVEIKRDLEVAPRDAVRVMTAHGAKGLQAPIVFLPDTLQAPTRVPPLLWPQDAENAGGADEAVLWPPRAALYEAVSAAEGERLARARDEEYRRLLYVAMTRAEDRLYVCGWATKQAAPAHCWYNLIQAGLADIAEDCEDPFLAEAGETASAHVLRVTCRQTAEVEKGAEAGAKAVLEELPPWVHRPPPPEPIPAEPLTPSRPDDAEPAVLSPLGPDDGARFRRGRLIHALLQTLPAIPAERRAAAADGYLHGSAPDLAAEARAEIAAETLAILSNPDFMALFGPDSQAEVPIVGRIGDQVISGQIDRLVVTPSEITIVDYKTNRPPPTRVEDVPALYLKQLAAYRAVLAEIYAETPVNCALLWTVGPHLMDVSGDLLAPYAP